VVLRSLLRSFTLSQWTEWKDLSLGVIWVHLEAL